MRRRLLVIAVVLAALLLPATQAPAQPTATRGEFAAAVTRELFAPITLHTRRAMQAELQAEGGFARNNPFNTTLRLPGSTSYNSVGVQNYTSAAQGVEATVKTLKQRCCGYWRIRQALRNNGSGREIVRAFGRSEWGTNLSLVLAVLDDIAHNRVPNVLETLELKIITS